MAAEGIGKILKLSLGVCFVCSLLVSTAAVSLRSIQEENKRLDKVKNLLIAADLYTDDASVSQIYEQKIEPKLIELATGRAVPEEQFDDLLSPETFDLKVMAKNPTYGETLPSDRDPASIKRRPKHMVVYLVRSGDELETVILPIYGMGLWSTLYGFLALQSDLQTVTGITYYEHAETPGLGGEIDNRRWKQSWQGKKVFDAKGDYILEVLKGMVDPSSSKADSQIDGLSGATLTTRGVDLMVEYWLGPDGYGPFLEKLREAA